MNIGIITFHWATNYGAVIQAYCLQEYLRESGASVQIINYFPRKYEKKWINFFQNPKNLKYYFRFKKEREKERLISTFRNKYFLLTQRFYSVQDLKSFRFDFDCLISGSDQVLNPFFTSRGEGHPTDAYYLSFGSENCNRIGYAVSFGHEVYPESAAQFAEKWINNFNVIGVREASGLKVLTQVKFKNESQVVPDPTILYGTKLFTNVGIPVCRHKKDYVCVYVLRERVRISNTNTIYIDEFHAAISIEEWLETIVNAKFLITNSYHGMIIAILSHVPFAAIAESKKKGMNDRFVTLLKILGLESRFVRTIDDAQSISHFRIDWAQIDKRVREYSIIGQSFLDKVIKL